MENITKYVKEKLHNTFYNECFFCLLLVLETDRPDPGLTEAEINYVPEQM